MATINKNGLIKYYHLLCLRCGIDAESRHEMLTKIYGTPHCQDLNENQLQEICNSLKKELERNGKLANNEVDENSTVTLLRKQVKASCGNLLAVQGVIKEKNWSPLEWNTIMGTIYNASGKQEFLTLNASQLRALAFEFNHQRKAILTARQNIQNNNNN